MANLMGEFEFWIETTGVISHDFRVKVTQDFDVIYRDGFQLQEYGDAEVSVYAGGMLLWVGKPSEMAGWLRTKVEHQIDHETDWGITKEDMIDALNEDREQALFARAHAVGM